MWEPPARRKPNRVPNIILLIAALTCCLVISYFILNTFFFASYSEPKLTLAEQRQKERDSKLFVSKLRNDREKILNQITNTQNKILELDIELNSLETEYEEIVSADCREAFMKLGNCLQKQQNYIDAINWLQEQMQKN